jgi:short-subunit dehydrogenase
MKPKSDFLGACQFVDSIQHSAAMGTSSLGNKYRTALVTGASSGIGLAFARMLLKEGLTVYGTSRNPDRAELDKEIQWLRLEAGSRQAVDSFIEQHDKLLSSIDIFINNAGSSYFSRESTSISKVSEGQQILLLGTPIRLSQLFLDRMRSRGSGVIVNVSSLAAIFPLPFMATYSASKAGLSAYTQGLMLTERESGVVLIDFQAGDYRTGFNANILKGDLEDADMERVWDRLEENMRASPHPARAADDLRNALLNGRSRTIRSGGFFQSHLAPLGFRLLPARLVRSAIRKYYRIG